MFHNRIQALFAPGVNGRFFAISGAVPTIEQATPPATPMQVPLADIYEAARKRAIEDHEVDKLFNPDFYDYQI